MPTTCYCGHRGWCMYWCFGLIMPGQRGKIGRRARGVTRDRPLDPTAALGQPHRSTLGVRYTTALSKLPFTIFHPLSHRVRRRISSQ